MATERFPAWIRPFVTRDRESRTEAALLARSLNEHELQEHTGDSGWCVRDELTHMVSADSDFIPLLRAILDGEHPDTSVFADTDARNEQHLEERRGRPIAETARELDENGNQLSEVFAQLTDADEIRQPEGFPFPLGGLIEGYSQHHQYHLGQIHKALGRSG